MNIWNDCPKAPITELLTFIVDNRGKTVPTSETGHVLIATNCIKTDSLYPKYEKVRYLSQETYDTFFRAHPIPGDIIFVNKGTPGRTCLVPNPVDFCIAQDMIALRCDESKIYNKYLLAVLRSSQIQRHIYNTSVGDVIPHFKKQFMDTIEIPLPTYEYQKWIGDLYYNLSNKIELNNKINAQLEEMAQAIFKSWFVDFEPFKDGKFVESELGLIPEGWRVFTLDEIVNNIGGYSYKGNELQSSSTAMATIKNFERGGGFKIDGYKEIVISKKIKNEQYVELFDVLVAHTDLTQNAEVVGNPIIVLDKSNYEKLILSMDLTKVVSKYQELSNALIYNILNTPNFKGHALGYVNGTTVLHMKKNTVTDYKVALPVDFNVLNSINHKLEIIYKRMSATFKQNFHLAQLRDTLLPKLMNGEIEI